MVNVYTSADYYRGFPATQVADGQMKRFQRASQLSASFAKGTIGAQNCLSLVIRGETVATFHAWNAVVLRIEVKQKVMSPLNVLCDQVHLLIEEDQGASFLKLLRSAFQILDGEIMITGEQTFCLIGTRRRFKPTRRAADPRAPFHCTALYAHCRSHGAILALPKLI